MCNVCLLVGLALAAPTVTVVDTFDTVAPWSVHADGGGGLTFGLERAQTVSPPGALRLRYQPAGTPGWGNLVRRFTLPKDARALVFQLRVVAAEPGAAMHVWLVEADGDMHMTQLRVDQRGVEDLERDRWWRVRIPLSALTYQPRGDRKPDLGRVDKLLLGCNFAGLEVLVDDLGVECGPPPANVPLPLSPTWAPADGPRGRVALLDEPDLPRTPGGFDPAALAALLTGHGYGATRLRAGDLADPQRFARAGFDLLLVNAPGFPVAAKEALLAYLKAGGAVFSCGGYAFDRPQVLTDAGWQDAGADSDPRGRLNARYGKPGDTMALEPLQIGLFDPTVRLTQVSAAELGGRRVEGRWEGLAGVSQAGLNSPVFPDQYGETEPLGQTFDRWGRPRGALGVLVQHFAGPFAGAAWGGVGVTNRWPFAPEAFGPAPLLAALDKLVSGVYVHSLRPEPVFVKAGERAQVRLTLANRGRRSVNARLRVSAGGVTLAESLVDLAAGTSREVSADWQPGPTAEDLLRADAVALVDERPVDERSCWLCVEQPAVVARGRALAFRGNYFESAGRPLFLTGTNQTGLMWHTPREHPATWDLDFQQMEDRGLMVWRVLHFSPFAARGPAGKGLDPLLLGQEPPLKLQRQTDAIVQLAQKHGVVLFIACHDWIPLSLTDEQLAAQRAWNRFWSSRYRQVPGLIWDLQNEPTVDWDLAHPPAHVLKLWSAFQAERGYQLAGPPRPGTAWSDLGGVAYEQFRGWLLDRWIRENVAGLKEGNPAALATVGYLQMRAPADKVGSARLLDFSNTHSYDGSRQFATSLRFADRRAIGKGLTLGEFGARFFHGLRVNGGDGEAGDQDRRLFNTTVGLTLGSGGAMALNWCWRGMDDVVFPWELLRSDRVPRPSAVDFRALTLAFRGLEPVYEPPAVYLLLPDSHRLGPRFNELDAALARSVDALTTLGRPFALLGEDDPLPPAAKVVLWPLPYCPSDATFERVARWVEAGGRLYFSGDLGFDLQRHYTRGARLARLGLPPALGRDPFAPTEGSQAPLSSAVGHGQVTYVPQPVELRDGGRVRALYESFLQAAGVAPWPLEPNSADVQAGVVPCRDGSQAVLAANWGAPRALGCGPLSLRVDREQLGWAHLGRDGAVLGVLAQGDVSCRGPVVSGGGPLLVLSRDGEDLRDSAALAVVPLSAGRVVLHSRHNWVAPVAVLGEVRAGAWQELGRLPLRTDGGELALDLAEDMLDAVVLVAEPAALADTARRLVAEVRLRGGG